MVKLAELFSTYAVFAAHRATSKHSVSESCPGRRRPRIMSSNIPCSFAPSRSSIHCCSERRRGPHGRSPYGQSRSQQSTCSSQQK